MTAWQVRWSGREDPATCTRCGKLSHVVASTAIGIPVVCVLLVVAGLMAGLITGRWWITALLWALAPVYDVWAWRRVRLWPISQASVRVARGVRWAGLAAWLLSLFGS